MPLEPQARARRPWPACPACGAATRRIARRGEDRAGPAAGSQRRYQCLATSCGWQGLLAREPAAADPSPPFVPRGDVAPDGAAVPAPARGHRWRIGLAMAAVVGVPLAVILVAGIETIARPAAGLTVAPGESHDGLPLRDRQAPIGGDVLLARADADGSAGAQPALRLRQGCAWGQPGRQPYRGTTEQALEAAGLPPEVVRQIAAARQAGRKDGRLEISRTAIRQVGGAREFDPRSMALTFGHTLCLNARVNFAPGHVEPADLFVATDASGRQHAVMVPDVCGNVTVLGDRAERGVVAGAAAALAQRSDALAMVAEALRADAEPDLQGGADGAGQDQEESAGLAVVPGGAGDLDGAAATGVATARGLSAVSASSGTGRVVGAPSGGAADPRWRSTPLRTALWQGLKKSNEPRRIVAVGLNQVSRGLERGSRAVSALKPLVTPLPSSDGGGSKAVNEVPEPGTLACVLAALAAAWWGGRRR